jgi:hypothetical protein
VKKRRRLKQGERGNGRFQNLPFSLFISSSLLVFFSRKKLDA